MKEELIALAERLERYDPKLSPDNRADEIELHRDIVLATGIGTMNPKRVEETFVRSLDLAMTLVPEEAGMDAAGERFRLESWTTNGIHADHVRATAWVAGAKRVYAATSALALSAAALRAQAQQGSDLAKVKSGGGDA